MDHQEHSPVLLLKSLERGPYLEDDVGGLLMDGLDRIFRIVRYLEALRERSSTIDPKISANREEPALHPLGVLEVADRGQSAREGLLAQILRNAAIMGEKDAKAHDV